MVSVEFMSRQENRFGEVSNHFLVEHFPIKSPFKRSYVIFIQRQTLTAWDLPRTFGKWQMCWKESTQSTQLHINPAKTPFGCLIYLNSYSQINKSCTALRVISLVAVACQYCWCTVNWVNIVRNPFSLDSFRVNLSTEASQLYKERERAEITERSGKKRRKFWDNNTAVGGPSCCITAPSSLSLSTSQTSSSYQCWVKVGRLTSYRFCQCHLI